MNIFDRIKQRPGTVTQTPGVGRDEHFAMESSDVNDVLNEDGTVKIHPEGQKGVRK